MIRKTALNKDFNSNTYLIGDLLSKEAMIVDPGADVSDIMEMCEGFDVKAIVLTHCHFDHICSAEGIRKMTGAPILASEMTKEFARDPRYNMSLFANWPVALKNVDRIVAEGDTVELGNNVLMILETPGHTPGSISILNFKERFALTGDTLFIESVGRTDLYGGSAEQLQRSLQKLLRAMKDEWRVLPGHGPEGFLWEIKKLNPFLPSLLEE